MRYGIWALGALIVGSFGAHFLLRERGYVLISAGGYNIEMSVPVLVIALALLYALVRLLLRLWRAPRQLGEALAAQRQRKAGSRLAQGLIHMTEGDYRRGERLLTGGADSNEAKVVNYLMAARAAGAQGSRQRRDSWLARAREVEPKASIAVALTQAELQLQDGDAKGAVITLERIEKDKPKHAGCLVLLAEARLAAKERKALGAMLPRLAKAKIDPDRLAVLLAKALDAMRSDRDFNREALAEVWSPLPMDLRRRPELTRARALLLDRLGRGDEAVKSLAAALRRGWQRELVLAYGEVTGSDSLKQLGRAEGWLGEHGEDAALLLTAARLSMRNELWGKARSYLETSLAIEPTPSTYALYGELLDRLGEGEAAARAYQSGLKIVTPEVDALPALTAPTQTPPEAPTEMSASTEITDLKKADA